MSKENKEMLVRIKNTLSLISTKGEDTLMMADCVRALEALANKEDTPEDKKGE